MGATVYITQELHSGKKNYIKFAKHNTEVHILSLCFI